MEKESFNENMFNGNKKIGHKTVKQILPLQPKLTDNEKQGEQLKSIGYSDSEISCLLKIITFSTNDKVSREQLCITFVSLKAKQTLEMEEVMQMTNNGIPIVNLLVTYYHKMASTCFKKVENREVPIDVVISVLKGWVGIRF